jgi:hypothetical protein
MDILFLHVPKFGAYSRATNWFSFVNYPPVGLLGLADYLRGYGYESQIVHLGVERHKYGKIDFAGMIAASRPAMVGLNLHWHFQSFDVIESARKIKQSHPELPVVLGGFTASLFAEEILREFDCVDYVIRGEAEVPLRELLAACRSTTELSRVSNLAYRENGEVRLNPITYVADRAMLGSLNYTDFSFMKDFSSFLSFSRYVRVDGLSDAAHDLLGGNRRMYPVVAGRGCANKCLFCGGSQQVLKTICNRTEVSCRSAVSMLDSLRDLEQVGFTHALLSHDPFGDSAEAEAFYLALFAGVRQRDIHISCELERWRFLPTREFVRGFRESFGKESVVALSLWNSDEIVRRKNGVYWFSNQQLESCLDMMGEEGVDCCVYFACGLPFEGGQQQLRAMAQYQRHLKRSYPRVKCRTFVIEIEPGSSLSVNHRALPVVPHRSSFMDYYFHHQPSLRSHCLQLGYTRRDDLNEKALGRFYCRNFCDRFGARRAAPFLCALMGVIWASGAMKGFDWVCRTLAALKLRRQPPQLVPQVSLRDRPVEHPIWTTHEQQQYPAPELPSSKASPSEHSSRA